ncbi:ripening-related protein grip22-like [Abrus precatorius]|uniref:Ripening-related protein grip22-like n=1 Tax=Abrus precatorius TaxID=3816 RepID=A0A8B8M9Y5_ABRPR|nr:ripening-related protein grip22-like [Abrus precatorius]
MANTRVSMVSLWLILNVILTLFPYLANASSCKANGLESPEVNPSGTHAILTVNDFARGGDGGGPSECDGKFHPLPERVVALSTGWYSKGARCGRKIKIKARNGRSTVAKVVDECDSAHGCGKSRACRTNVVDASKTVWKDLGLNVDDGEVPVIWTMA